MDRDVRLPIFRIRPGAKPHRDIWAGILWRIRRCRHELAQIEVRIRYPVHGLLARRRAIHDDRRNRALDRIAELPAKALIVCIEQQADTAAAGQHANDDSGIREAFHIIENHRRPFLRRSGYRSAGTDITINAGNLRIRICFHIRLHQLSRLLG